MSAEDWNVLRNKSRWDKHKIISERLQMTSALRQHAALNIITPRTAAVNVGEIAGSSFCDVRISSLAHPLIETTRNPFYLFISLSLFFYFSILPSSGTQLPFAHSMNPAPHSPPKLILMNSYAISKSPLPPQISLCTHTYDSPACTTCTELSSHQIKWKKKKNHHSAAERGKARAGPVITAQCYKTTGEKWKPFVFAATYRLCKQELSR